MRFCIHHGAPQTYSWQLSMQESSRAYSSGSATGITVIAIYGRYKRTAIACRNPFAHVYSKPCPITDWIKLILGIPALEWSERPGGLISQSATSLGASFKTVGSFGFRLDD